MNNKGYIFKNKNNNKHILVREFNEEYHLFKLNKIDFINTKDDEILINDELYTINTIKQYIIKKEWFQSYIINNPQIECIQELNYHIDENKVQIMIECDEYIDSTFVF